jgi:predicted Zn-dependent peptidase
MPSTCFAMRRLRFGNVSWLSAIALAAIAPALGQDGAVQFDVPGGLRAMIAASDAFVAEIVVSVAAGTEDEGAGQNGVAAATAEAMLAGDLGGENIRRLLALRGVTAETGVGQHTATFRFVLPDAQVLGFIPLLARLFTRADLSESAWSEALQIQSASLGRARTDPLFCSARLFARLLWIPAMRERPPTDRIAVLEQFRRAHYTRDRMVIAVAAGNTDPLKKAIMQGFSADPDPRPAFAQARPEQEPRPAPVTRYIATGEDQFLLAGHGMVLRGGDDFFAAQLLASVLGGSLSSRLYHRLREREHLVYTVEASCVPVGVSLLYLQVSCRTSDPSQALRIVQQEFESLAARPVARKELETATAILRSRLLADRSSVRESLSWRMAPGRGPDDGLALLQRIDPGSLLAVARRLLRPQALVVIMGSTVGGSRPEEYETCR